MRHATWSAAYRLVRELGVGGMGAVWLADRADGLMQRSGALKLPFGPFSGDLAAHIARERENLASLDHRTSLACTTPASPPTANLISRSNTSTGNAATVTARKRGSASRRGCACSCRRRVRSRMRRRSPSSAATSSRQTCSSMPEVTSSCSTSALQDCSTTAASISPSSRSKAIACSEDRSFKRTFRGIGAATGWPGPLIEALLESSWLTVAGRVLMTPVEREHQRPESRIYPDDSAALLRSGEARAHPIPAVLGDGSPERAQLRRVSPLAVAAHGQARAAVPGAAGRARACRHEPRLRRRTARRPATASTVGLQTPVREHLLG